MAKRSIRTKRQISRLTPEELLDVKKSELPLLSPEQVFIKSFKEQELQSKSEMDEMFKDWKKEDKKRKRELEKIHKREKQYAKEMDKQSDPKLINKWLEEED